MRIVGFFVFVFGTSLTLVYVHSKPARSYNTFLLPNDIIRVKKRHDDLSTGYLEQCGVVTFPKAQRGVVNVLAFLDSSWPYSHRQAIMLKMLNERLRRSGLPDALFFVVNVDPSSARTVDNAEDDLEREAWLGVSPDEIESFSNIVKTADSLAMSMTPDIQLIQDNEDLQIWKGLRGSRDQVLVIDRCGKLTYQVIVPWSILHFPYVKAAILSTYKDEPCGPCDVINDTRDPFVNRDETTPQRATQDSDMQLASTTEEYFQNDREGHLPVTTESDLEGVIESTETSQSGPTPMCLTSKVTDVLKDTTMDSNPEDQEGFTTEPTSIGPETTDHTDLAIAHPLNDYEDTSCNTTDETFNIQKTQILPSMEQPVTLQNTDIDLPDLEQSVPTMGSTNSINSDTTGSTYPVHNYETTVTIYTKGHDEDTTAGTSSDSPATDFLVIQEKSSSLMNSTDSGNFMNTDATESTNFTNSYFTESTSFMNSDATESTNFMNSDATEPTNFMNSDASESTGFINSEATESTSFINSDATKSTYPIHHYGTTETIYAKDYDEDTTAEKSLKSPTTNLFNVPEKSSILNDGAVTQISLQTESTAMSINSDNENLNSFGKKSSTDFSTTNKNIIVDTTTEGTVNSNTAIVFEVEEEIIENNDSKGAFNESSDIEDTTLSSDVPIRIIMHAPHFHVDGDSTRMHEYLVLNTGSSDYHRHLSSYDATRSYRGPQDFREKPEYLRNQEIEDKMWSMTNVIYNRDESPGLYGEVADYWKNSGGQDNSYDYNEETETSGVEQNNKESIADDRILKKPFKSNDQSSHDNVNAKQESTVPDDGPDESKGITERFQGDFADKSTSESQAWNDEILDVEEEEMRSKLIAHYSKLLPWIYYVLD